ncbi:unnamed protein product [Victoria cruziana]
MHGRRSLEPELHQYMPKVNRLYREIQVRPSAEMGAELPPEVQMLVKEEPSRLLREFFIPNEYDRGTTTMGTQIRAVHYEIKTSVINIFSSFHDFENQNLYKHVDEFLDVYETMRISHVDDDALRLRLLPFSLKEEAKHWLKLMIATIRIISWNELQREFLKKYYPINKTNPFRRAITSFYL